MDDVVLRSMAKWPDVPAVFGWLALDRRGQWLVRGETIGNTATRRFIARNYAADERGRWYFQNGPQRVYVELHYTPWVYLLGEEGRLLTHTAREVERIDAVWIDESCNLLLATEHGPGLVNDRDLATLVDSFSGRGGSVLADETLEQALAALAAHCAQASEGDPVGGAGEIELYLAWGGFRPRVGFLPAAEVPVRFGFDPRPESSERAAGVV